MKKDQKMIKKLEEDIIKIKCSCYDFCKRNSVLTCETCRVKEQLTDGLVEELIKLGWHKDD